MKSVVIRNASALYLVKISGYLIPLFTLPYLARVLGPEYFGYSAIAMAVAQYFIIFSNYGFDLTATGRIARYPGKIKKISNVFWHVILIRLGAFIVGLIVITFIYVCSPIDEVLRKCLFAAYFIVLGTSIYPQWLFQGMQNLSYISIVTTVIRLISIPLIYTCVNSKDDLLIYLWINTSINICIGLFSLYVVFNKGWIVRVKLSARYTRALLLNGWHIFISIMSTTLYTSSITVVLGILVGPASVGAFASANKLTQMAQSLYQPVAAAVYPKVVSALSVDKQSITPIVKRLFLFQILTGGVIFFIFFIFSEEIIYLVFGSEFYSSVDILKVLSITPLLIGLSNIAGVQILIPLGYRKEFSKIIVISGIIGLIFSIFGSFYYSALGAAFAVAFTELLVLVLMVLSLFKLTSDRRN
ncbi:oligosaccharide flippase family protein [Vibrio fluvialis]|nr:oligosaccharide flippase family protein [Vibrio fluvialis]